MELKYKQKFMVVTEKGEILSKDLKEIVFRKTGAGVPVTIPWADVRSIDGRPAQEVLAKLQSEYGERICRACNGGTVVKKCGKCKGTGSISEKVMPCKRCKGTGSVSCAARGCKEGRTSCPGPCIKWGVGRWEHWPGHGMCRIWEWVGKDGKRHRQGASRAHVGEVYEVKNGEFLKKGRCKVCGGKATVPCKSCNETNKAKCSVCNGSKVVPDPQFATACPDCVKGVLVCKACNGTGLLGQVAAARQRAEAVKGAAEDKRDPNAIYLKDGRVIRGKIMMRVGNELIVKTEAGKTISITKDQIDPAP